MFIELLRKRRSIRQFTPETVEREKVDLLVEAALRSPSSRSLNPWEFVVVTDPQIIEGLATAKPHGAAFAKNAPLAIVVCGDPKRCDVWVEDCSIAAANIHYAAADLGLGSCWVQIRLRDNQGGGSAEDYIRHLLGLPERLAVLAFVAIGYPREVKPGHQDTALLRERVHDNRYGESGPAA